MRAFLTGPLVLALVASGCLGTVPAADDVAPAANSAPSAMNALGLAGSGCTEGGGHSVHPMIFNPLPSPWMPADILDDVGPQLTYSEVPDPMKPIPEKGSTMGNYHATMTCDTWTFRGEEKPDLVFGFVGMKIETPPFGTDGPTHQYLVTVIATSDSDVNAALHDAGFHPMLASATSITMPGDWNRIQMSTDHNGDYDSLFKPKAFGEMKATHVRLWFQIPNGAADCTGHECAGDGTFTPIALDLLAQPGGRHFVAEGQGYFSHSGTNHHDPMPGAYGHTAAVQYREFERTFEWGPHPTEVRLTDAYEH